MHQYQTTKFGKQGLAHTPCRRTSLNQYQIRIGRNGQTSCGLAIGWVGIISIWRGSYLSHTKTYILLTPTGKTEVSQHVILKPDT
jgi:hypothetical protein